MAGMMDRRSFLKVTGATTTGLAGILASGRAPAYAQGQKLHMVRWVDFVPAADEALKKQAVEAGKALGAEVTVETINANDIQPRITAAISSGSGADIFLLQHNLAHLYEKSLVDVGDVVDAIGKEQGGYYPAAEGLAKVNGVWRAAPHCVVGGLIAYRKSLFAEVGANEFPKTWEAYREVGKKLKAKGFPMGQTAGHTFGDAPAFWYPFMWAFGGKEVGTDGKVAINSKETVEVVKFGVGFWKDAVDEGGLAWDDSNNNRAFLSGTICASLNGASIYIESLRNKEKYKTDTGALMHTDIQHARPAGGAGRILRVPHAVQPRHHELLEEPEARQGLPQVVVRQAAVRGLVHRAEGIRPGADQDVGSPTPCGSRTRSCCPSASVASKLRLFGYAGPANAKASEVYSKYIIIDMYAKAIQGMSAEDSVKWAESELKKIYVA